MCVKVCVTKAKQGCGCRASIVVQTTQGLICTAGCRVPSVNSIRCGFIVAIRYVVFTWVVHLYK